MWDATRLIQQPAEQLHVEVIVRQFARLVVVTILPLIWFFLTLSEMPGIILCRFVSEITAIRRDTFFRCDIMSLNTNKNQVTSLISLLQKMQEVSATEPQKILRWEALVQWKSLYPALLLIYFICVCHRTSSSCDNPISAASFWCVLRLHFILCYFKIGLEMWPAQDGLEAIYAVFANDIFTICSSIS